ncbi:MAG: putative serine protease HhoA precursor [Planctomycetota bacterium]
MNRRRFLSNTAATAVWGTLAATHGYGQQPAVKVALLVGVNKYDKRGFADKPLEFAERDVTDLATELRAQGFTVRLLLGSFPDGDPSRATKKNIDRALQELLAGRNARDLVLVGFAGHGQQMPLRDAQGQEQKGPDGKDLEDAFFCPVDGVRSDATTLVSLIGLMETLDQKGGVNLVLVDACRDNPDPSRGSRSSITGDELNGRLPTNTAIMFSCAARQQAWETKSAGGGHGVFFYNVLEGLRGGAAKKNGDVTWGSLVEHVKDYTNVRAKEWLPEQAEYASKRRSTNLADLPFQTPHELKNLIDQPVLAKVTLPVPLPPVVAPKPLAAPFTEAEARAAQRAWATFKKTETEIKNKLGMRLALIPPGEFQMGSPFDEAERESDEIQHRVRITRPFWLGVYEVTQNEWETVMGSQPSYFSSSGGGKDKVSGLDTSRFPVESVSWDDATEFCRRLSVREGQEYRLPTEAEWEYACRAGTTTAYHFGGVLNGDKANVDGNYPYGTTTTGKYLGRTTRVGEYGANAFGLYDMHGNVWEWCGDWYDDQFYANSAMADPENLKEATTRVLRGGSWGSYARVSRSADRVRYTPAYRNFDCGLRVLCLLR